MVKRLFAIVILAVVSVSMLIGFSACLDSSDVKAIYGILDIFYGTNEFGIPNGYYGILHEDGTIGSTAGESALQIFGDSAEYYYAKYSIVEDEGDLYLSGDGIWLQIKYDKTTKVLTVYLPEEGIYDSFTITANALYFPSEESRMAKEGTTELHYKKK